MKAKILIFLVLFHHIALSITADVKAHEQMEYVVRAVEISPAETPRIDGRLDESVWSRAQAIEDFTQRDPLPDVPASEKGWVSFLFDKENLYIGCRFYDSHPENIIKELGRREAIGNSDHVGLFFDTFHNHRTGYLFAMNPYGIQLDAQIYNDDQYNYNWDAIWESAGSTDSIGWIAEFKIPFFNIRFPDEEDQVWGFNLQRVIPYKAERITWKPISFDDRNNVRMSKLGHLAGLRGIKRSRNVEFYPYGLSGFTERVDEHRKGKRDVGFDFRYGISSGVSLDATVNPDYAQVEADVLEINLTRYPTRFPEKRKFFLEGTEIFNTPVELFYSRRIGASGDILWGTKLTGRSGKGGLEYGILASQTGDWNYFGLEDKEDTREEAFFSVARLKKGFAGGSNIGMIYTNKSAAEGDRSQTAGIDGLFLFNEVYRATFQFAKSWNPGSTTDDNYYSAGVFRYAIPWTFRITALRLDPDFEVNSTGYMAKEKHRGQQQFRTVVSYNPLVEKYGIRQFNIFSSGLIGNDLLTDGYIEDWRANNPGLNMLDQYENGELQPGYWLFDQAYGIRTTDEMNISWWYGVGKTNELTHSYYPKNHGFTFSSPQTGKWQKVTFNANISWGSFYNWSQKVLGKRRNINGGVRSWIRSNLGLELSGEYTNTYNPGGRIDGRHYRLTMRNTYLVTKDLFIRLYTQGRWSTTYYDGEQISNRYLLSLLMGWEFRSGSWFYIAYNEGREDRDDFFDPHFETRDFMMTDRTLVVKLQYAFFR